MVNAWRQALLLAAVLVWPIAACGDSAPSGDQQSTTTSTTDPAPEASYEPPVNPPVIESSVPTSDPDGPVDCETVEGQYGPETICTGDINYDANQRAEAYEQECHSPKFAEYRDYLRAEGTLEESCPYGYSSP